MSIEVGDIILVTDVDDRSFEARVEDVATDWLLVSPTVGSYCKIAVAREWVQEVLTSSRFASESR